MSSFDLTHFELLDKPIFGKAVFEPPFKANSSFVDEARFVFIIKGKSNLYVPNDTLSLETSDCFLMKCDNFVNVWKKNEDEDKSQVMVMHFYPDVLKHIYDNNIPEVFKSSDVKPHGPVAKLKTNEMLVNYMKSLEFYFQNPSLMNDELIKLKVRELIQVMLNSDHTGVIKNMFSDLFKANAYDFKEIIHAHLYEDLSLQDLAFFTGLSLSTFKRKFKTVFNTSPTQYIKSKRLEKAISLLQTTDQRISEIAYDCGFNDIGYFSKLFKSTYQVSPSDYKKSLV
ncbi:AraC family transcriptional regulator [Flammeovirga sp. OC4]|uniref:helix-turn-helix domain-containing protein n=1 Tax=Flammeovirga sp. OC4 TaxID=1382345 RepID=UPI0005C5FCB2|nr:AraC family transcriptional regulator [Flammeovirga sp. OC4]